MEKRRRKKYFLSGSIQPRLLLGFAVLVFILVVIAGGLFYVLANRELSSEYYKAHSTLRYVMQNLLPWLLLVNLAGILVTLFLAVFYTHRIAGPAYRIQQDLRKIGQGVLTTRVKTRRREIGAADQAQRNLNHLLGRKFIVQNGLSADDELD